MNEIVLTAKKKKQEKELQARALKECIIKDKNAGDFQFKVTTRTMVDTEPAINISQDTNQKNKLAQPHLEFKPYNCDLTQHS